MQLQAHGWHSLAGSSHRDIRDTQYTGVVGLRVYLSWSILHARTHTSELVSGQRASEWVTKGTDPAQNQSTLLT